MLFIATIVHKVLELLGNVLPMGAKKAVFIMIVLESIKRVV